MCRRAVVYSTTFRLGTLSMASSDQVLRSRPWANSSAARSGSALAMSESLAIYADGVQCRAQLAGAQTAKVAVHMD